MRRGYLEQRDKLMLGRLVTQIARAAVSGGAAVPAVLDGESAAGFGLDGLRRFDLAGGGSDDDVREEIAALDGGGRVQKLDALQPRERGGRGRWRRRGLRGRGSVGRHGWRGRIGGVRRLSGGRTLRGAHDGFVERKKSRQKGRMK